MPEMTPPPAITAPPPPPNDTTDGGRRRRPASTSTNDALRDLDGEIGEVRGDLAEVRERLARLEAQHTSFGWELKGLRSAIENLNNTVLSIFTKMFAGQLFVIIVALASIAGLVGVSMQADVGAGTVKVGGSP